MRPYGIPVTREFDPRARSGTRVSGRAQLPTANHGNRPSPARAFRARSSTPMRCGGTGARIEDPRPTVGRRSRRSGRRSRGQARPPCRFEATWGDTPRSPSPERRSSGPPDQDRWPPPPRSVSLDRTSSSRRLALTWKGLIRLSLPPRHWRISESPTLSHSQTSSSNIAATIVVPMPASVGSVSPAMLTSRLA